MAYSNWPSFQNVSNSLTAAPFAPMQVVDALLKDNNHLILKCDQVGSSDNPNFNRRIVFNGPCAIAPQGYGRCTESVRVTAAWDTGTPNPGESWGIKRGQWALTKGGIGDFLVDGVIDSGTKRMYGRWGGIVGLIGKAPSNIAKGASGTVNIWAGAGGSEAVISGWTVTAFANGAAITSAKWVTVNVYNGIYYVGPWEC